MTAGPRATNRSFWRRWLDQPFIRSIGGVGGAAGLSQLAAIAVAPILARLYPAEAFGQFGVIVAYCNIAAALLLFGLNDAILAAADEVAADQLLTAGVKISAVALVPAVIMSALAVDRGYFGLGPLPIAALWFFGEWLFVLIFGPDWQVAGRMAALCAPWIALMLPVAALSQILIVTHRPGLKLLFDAAFVGGLAILQFVYQAAARGDDALPFVHDLSIICAAAYALYIPLIAFALWRPGSVAAR